MRNRWLQISVLIALPLILFLIIAEQMSWRPRTLFIGTSNFTLAFTPDSEMLVVGRRKWFFGDVWSVSPRNYQLWNVSSKELQRTLPDADSQLAMAAYAPNARVLAGVAGAGAVKLWNMQTGKLERTLLKPMPEGLATASLAFSADSKMLTEGRGDGGNYVPPYPGSALLWDIEKGALRRTFNTGGNTVSSLFFSPDGKKLIGSGLYAVQIWDIQSGSLLCKLKDRSLLNPRLAISSDGRTLAGVEASLDKSKPVILWDVATGMLKRKLSGSTGRVDAKSFVVAPSRVSALVFAPDGRTLAIVSNETGLPPCPPGPAGCSYSGPGIPVNGQLTLWDMQTGAQLHTFKNGLTPIGLVAFSPDGQMLVVASDREVIVWETGTGRLLRKLISHRKPVGSLAFAPDGCTLATGSEDQTVKLWRIK